MSSKKELRQLKKRGLDEKKQADMMQSLDEHSKKILTIRTVMKDREKARKDKDFSKSDDLRDKLLKEFNVEVRDQLGGPSGWRFLDGSSKKLPAGISVPGKSDVDETKPVKKEKRQRDDSKVSSSIKDEVKKKLKTETSVSSKNLEEQKRNIEVLKSVISNSAPASGTRNVDGVLIEDIIVGKGTKAESGNRIKVHYIGRLKSNNKLFDSSTKKPFMFKLGRSEVIKGWDIGCKGMLVGGKRKLTIPPEKAYGRSGAPPTIPPNATLVFEVTLLDVN